MKHSIYQLLIGVVLISFLHSSQARSIDFDLAAATPVGSWQLRESTDTDHKGRKTVSTMRTSLVGTETRGNEKHYWVEMAMESFKVKKSGKRKKQGDRIIMKSLIPASTFNGDPANVMSNLRAFGSETIMQTGKDDPMRMKEGSSMSGLMNSMLADIQYDFKKVGNEQITAAGKTLDAMKVEGSGSGEINVVFKKINIESDATFWLSKQVPFGTVKTEGTSMTNGKQSSHSSELLEFGQSGAVSEITREPVDMPEMPNIGDLFGK